MFRVCADFILFWFLGLKRLFLLFKIYKKIFYSQWVFCKILAISTQLIKLKWSHSKNGQFVGSLKMKDIHILGPYWLWNQTDLLNLWNYLRVVTKYGIFSASVGEKKKKSLFYDSTLCNFGKPELQSSSSFLGSKCVTLASSFAYLSPGYLNLEWNNCIKFMDKKNLCWKQFANC